MPIRFNESAFRHGITPEEIRSSLEYPLYRSRALSRRDAHRVVYLVVGQVAGEALIEVAAELTTEPAWDVFHAMLLRRATADRIRSATAGEVDLPATRTQRM